MIRIPVSDAKIQLMYFSESYSKECGNTLVNLRSTRRQKERAERHWILVRLERFQFNDIQVASESSDNHINLKVSCEKRDATKG